MLLVGSHALAYYGRLKGRNPDDFDLLTTANAHGVRTIKGIKYDFHSTTKDETTKKIYELCQVMDLPSVSIPLWGEVKVAPLEILKVLKISSVPTDKAKHLWDLSSLEDILLNQDMIQLAKERLQETQDRLKKDKFFNQYDVFRIMDHDELHAYVNAVPSYLKIVENSVEPQKHKFESLTTEEKNRIVFEECLVLSLERWLIPKMVAIPQASEAFAQKFLSVEKSSDPALIWLSRLSIDSKVKDNPWWISAYICKNFESVHNFVKAHWEPTVQSLPPSFWTRVLEYSTKK